MFTTLDFILLGIVVLILFGCTILDDLDNIGQYRSRIWGGLFRDD